MTVIIYLGFMTHFPAFPATIDFQNLPRFFTPYLGTASQTDETMTENIQDNVETVPKDTYKDQSRLTREQSKMEYWKSSKTRANAKAGENRRYKWKEQPQQSGNGAIELLAAAIALADYASGVIGDVFPTQDLDGTKDVDASDPETRPHPSFSHG